MQMQIVLNTVELTDMEEQASIDKSPMRLANNVLRGASPGKRVPSEQAF